MKILAGTAFAAGLFALTMAFGAGHGGWTAVEDESSVAFGSVKSDLFGEVHHFTKVGGSVDSNGVLKLSIDLSSVETNIDIRNERMGKHLFQDGSATAKITGDINTAELGALKAGETAMVDFEGNLAFGGAELDIEAKMIVVRLTNDRVMVSTADFIMVSTEDLGIDAGINELMKLAELPGITRVTPVAVRVVFER
ncbi:MAG: YceI family protein [Hyphomicrobiales bacterium]